SRRDGHATAAWSLLHRVSVAVRSAWREGRAPMCPDSCPGGSAQEMDWPEHLDAASCLRKFWRDLVRLAEISRQLGPPQTNQRLSGCSVASASGFVSSYITHILPFLDEPTVRLSGLDR